MKDRIAAKLKKLRDAKHLSLRALSDLTEAKGFKISHATIERIERGYDSKGETKGSVKIDDLKVLCECLDCSFRQLLEEAGYIQSVTEKPASLFQEEFDALTPDCQKEIMLIMGGMKKAIELSRKKQ